MFPRIEFKKKKNLIKRWCEYCHSKFIKNGKYSRVCPDCTILNQSLKDKGIEPVFRAELAKVIKVNYWYKLKVTDVFNNIEEGIKEKQLWYIDETNHTQYMIMRMTDLKDILNKEKMRLEEVR